MKKEKRNQFHFEYMANDDDGALCVNSDIYSKKEAYDIAQKELGQYEVGAILETVLFKSFIEFGYVKTYTDGYKRCWHIKDLDKPITKKPSKKAIPVWVIKAVFVV